MMWDVIVSYVTRWEREAQGHPMCGHAQAVLITPEKVVEAQLRRQVAELEDALHFWMKRVKLSDLPSYELRQFQEDCVRLLND